MKTLRLIPVLLTLTLLLFNCSNDDDNNQEDPPVIVNEEEVITTLTVVLTPTTAGPEITLETKDLDGDGPNPPVVSVSGNLTPNTTYNGVITILNETEDPAEDITEEVEEESDEHQFLYTIGGSLELSTEYTNFDTNNNPLGTNLNIITANSSTGTLTFTLRHEPTKPNDGTLDGAGGETDITATFPIVIE